MKKILFDSHTHLTDDSLDEKKVEELINLYKNDEYLDKIVDIAFNVESAKKTVKNANENDFIFATVGVHPHDVLCLNDDALIELENLLTMNKKVVAVGEIGLDYYKNRVEENIQKEAFIKQIKLAKKAKMPIVIHDRDAHEDVFRILSEQNAFNSEGVLLHCYSGDIELARGYISAGAVLSISGVVTFKNAEALSLVAKEIPLEHLLIETDAPYLAPVPFRGKENNSTYVKYVADKIAELKGISQDEVYEKTNENAKKFFRI